MQKSREENIMPIGPLMIERRLIERIIPLLKSEIERLNKTNKISPSFVPAAVDFFRVYADKCHHGKEEDVLFNGLLKKPLKPEHKKIIQELLDDHVNARKLAGRLESAGNTCSGKDVIENLKALSELYPVHIDKEDKHFFIPVMQYFSKEEQARMLSEFREFDRKIIHEKYRGVVEYLETEHGFRRK